MPRRNVRNLVSHHTREFGFVVGRKEQSFIYVEEPTRKCKGVHFIRINYLNREWHLSVRVKDDVLADTVYVLRNDRIVYKLRLAIDFGSRLAALPHFLFSRAAHLGDQTGIDVPFAN